MDIRKKLRSLAILAVAAAAFIAAIYVANLVHYTMSELVSMT